MKNSKFLVFRALIYSIFLSPHAALLQIFGKIQTRGVFMRNVRVKMRGKNCSIFVGAGTHLKNLEINLKNASLKIGENSHIRNTNFKICETSILIGERVQIREAEIDANAPISIGNDFTIHQNGKICAYGNAEISIGDDCMFSWDIEIQSGDGHRIRNSQNEILNFAKPIFIGNHVWIAAHARILKGSKIADGSVVGNGSTVLGACENPNSVYVGVPAKMVKSGITWER